MKGAFVVVQGKGRSCTSMCPRHGCIHARRATTRNIPLFQGVATHFVLVEKFSELSGYWIPLTPALSRKGGCCKSMPQIFAKVVGCGERCEPHQ
ncbi:MAG: hypothetical protein P8179_02500 [Candidatus Thiodiazotropha sp.]